MEASIRAAWIAFLFGLFIPDKSDFERGRIESKKFLTFDDVDGELPFTVSSPDFFRALSFEKNPFNPVDPERGLKSPSTLSVDPWRTGDIGDDGLWSVSIRGIAIALRSCKYAKKYLKY